MAKDILLFGRIGEYSASYFFDQIKEALESDSEEELILRASTEGGSPDYMMSIIEKIQELAGQMYFKGGASLHSAGFFAMCYLLKERVSCMDTSQALVHRAAYPTWIESDSSFKGSVYETLMVNSNKNLEKAFRARIDVVAFEALPQMKDRNYTVKDIFSLETRVEIVLNAKDLKAIGLVGKINKITPAKATELAAQVEAFKNCNSLEDFKLAAQKITSIPEKDKPEPQINKIMTLAELKAAHPELAAQIKNEGVTEGSAAGMAAEKARIAAWNEFVEIDAVAVKAGIDSGKIISMNEIAAFAKKAMSPAHLAKLNADAAPAVGAGETPAVDPTKTPAELATEKRIATIEASLDAQLGLTVAK